MVNQFILKAWRRFQGQKLLVIMLLIGLFNPLSMISTVQAAGQPNVSRSIINDLRGNNPTAWTTNSLVYAPQGAVTPGFVYQTILNGAQFDSGHDITIDSAGNAYVLARAYDTSNDVMIAKLSPSGVVSFVTYLRGSLTDWGTGLALDGNGGLWVSGWTDSSDFPTVNAAQPVKDNTRSAFLARISTSNGALLYSSFFGANRADEFHDIALGSNGEIYLVGKTDSTDFPTVNPIQSGLNLTNCFCDDAFILRLSADGRTVLYSTYLGGGLDDQADSIGLDSSGNIYVAGITKSDDFPTVNPIQPNRSGDFDLWAARISADGAHLDYSTYLGGTNPELLARMAVDPAGYATLVGTTNSNNFPTTAGAYQLVFGGGLCGSAGFDQRSCYDGFVTRLSPDGSSLVYSTYLGGSNDDEARGVALDNAGNAYVVGYHISSDVPPSEFDIVVSSLDASGSQLRYSVSVWSAVANDGGGIALGSDGDVYFTGAQNAPSDTYIARLSQNSGPNPTPTPTSTPLPPTPTPIPPTPTPSGSSLHVGDLDGSASGSRIWQASVRVLVHDAAHNPVANVTVSGAWSHGASGSSQCVTGSDGNCTLTKGSLRRNVSSVTFTVQNLAKSGSTYNSSANHDPDGDSNGTMIIVSRP
jgi:hypothetical protein